MPDKEGSEDEKTAKGVVKKKKKQIMGEEGYDTYRDNIMMRGGDHRSKETKEKSYTPSKQSKGQTIAQKAAKGKSALELVKADITKKYGKGAIMDVSKKKANEELDLTKIAEAFGGYVVEANGKNGKKNNKKRDSIDDFIDADNPFNVQARKDAERDIEDTGGTDTRSSFTRQDSFQKSGKFKQPETNPLRKKGEELKPDSVKFTKKPGEATVKSYIDPSQIDPKIAAREKAKREKEKTIEKSPETIKQKQERKKGGQEFKRTGKITKDDDESLSKDLEKTTEGPRRARKRRKDAASFAQVKADIDTADAARKAKGKGEYASDYEKRLSKAYDKGLETARETGKPPAGQVLPQAKTKTIQGQPQKGASDATKEFNRQQNLLRRIQRQGMADSGANPFTQPPLPEVDPLRRPSSPFASTINPKSNRKNETNRTFKDFNQELETIKDPYKRIETFYANQGKPVPDRFKNREIGGASGGSKKGDVSQTDVKPQDSSLETGSGFTSQRDGTLTRYTPPKKKSLLSKSIDFAKKNPATAFLTLDTIRKYFPSRSPFGVQGGRAGTRSAAR